ncbi:MAG TPA: ABC transporter ATP-binding protein [Bacteroidales bacterium]|nr:ABC transporter ATP-binding protein [Bacteroidales bacterium]
MQNAIKITDVSKYYLIADHDNPRNKRNRKKKFCALRKISFEVKSGKTLAITGPNGSGKSTLLKLIAEVTYPSEGIITTTGRVVSILEIGVGFNPELSGLENIYLSAGLYGINKKNLTDKLPYIVELFGFSEFLDTPVKYYSSGMYMRLAFSVITRIDADIYLFDEILSVGDTVFQTRALEEIRQLKKKGATICFVSHNPNEIAELCDSMLLLNKGEIVYIGSPGEALKEFQKIMANPDSNVAMHNHQLEKVQLASGKNQLTTNEHFLFDASHLQISSDFKTDAFINADKDIRLRLEFLYLSDKTVQVGFLIKDRYQTVISSMFQNFSPVESPEVCFMEVVFQANTFNPSTYLIDVIVFNDNVLSVLYPSILRCNFTSENISGTTLGYVNTFCRIQTGTL